MSKPNTPGPDTYSAGRRATVWRLIWTWIQTLLGTLFLGLITAGAALMFGLHWNWAVGILSLTMILPLVSWYFSASLVKRLTGCRKADPSNPYHRRLIRIVDRLYPKTGLPRKPEVFISPMKLPNAFATGRTPNDAFIAATEGLFFVGLNDDEFEAVLAHELAHVRHYDVAINSMLAVLGSLFSILLAAAFPRMFHFSGMNSRAVLLDKLSSRMKDQRKQFFLPVGGFLGFIVMLVVFYLVSTFTRLVSLFVARTRESAADAQAAYWTGKPCALSSALQKINRFMKMHVIDVRQRIITRGMTPLLLVSEFDDEQSADGLASSISRWWRNLGANHPPMSVRIKALDRMNGSSCPRLS